MRVVTFSMQERLTWWLVRILRVALAIVGIDIGFGITYIPLVGISPLVLITTGIGIGLAYILLVRLLPSLLSQAEIGFGMVYKFLVRILHPAILAVGIAIGSWIGYSAANIARLD